VIKAGDKVYRVVEYTPHSNEPENTPLWKVQEREVKSVGKCIMLRTYFTGIWRTKFQLLALGSIFHETAADALVYFIEQQVEAVRAACRARDLAIDAQQWATLKLKEQP
jgi:hypothetical protein